ncbi:MAG: septum formation protein Maf [SAR202 cluster bacterium]|nr:septum formation protein Maf [SAR202 cluster bacterium]
MDSGINRVLKALQGKGAETSQMSVRYGVSTGDLLVQPRLRDPALTVATGQTSYRDEVLGSRFRIASPSFFQVNTRQTERLVTLLRALVKPDMGLLVDAYAGVGTFSVLLAPIARRVVAIEESVSAVKDAEHNAAGLDNVTFLLGKTEHILARMTERPDVLVLDPPRAGCRPEALEAVVRLRPKRLLYVSCDPETLGRDLRVLLSGPYRLSALVPLDMFPQTHHIECVAVLELADDLGVLPFQPLADPRLLILASASPRRRDLLQVLGVPFTVAPSSVDESHADDGDDGPEAYVAGLALAKAMDVASGCPGDGLVIGADTTVALDGMRLGKPASPAEARGMLVALRGRTHEVFTGLAVMDGRTGRHSVTVERSRVAMRDYSDRELEAYVASGGPFDKAGGYAIQDSTFRPALRVEGCVFNVVGLPLCRLPRILDQFGLSSPASLVFGDGECRICSLWMPVSQEGPS